MPASPSRRAVLAMTVLAAVALPAVPACGNRGRGLTVVIVGAGAAGLYAARLLLDQGAEVVVLEAADHYGGRILTLDGFAGFPIELGAEEIHGRNSTWFDLVNATGSAFVTAPTTDYIAVGGEMLADDEALALSDFAAASDFYDEVPDYEGAEIAVSERISAEGLAARTWPLLEAWIGNEYGASNQDIGSLALSEGDALWTAGEENFGLKDTSMLTCLEDAVGDAVDSVVLRAAVTRIATRDGAIVVTTSDGTEYTADGVIVTVPLPVLRDGDIAFEPALPADKLAALQTIGMGAGMKIILAFTERFWAEGTGSIYGAEHVPEFWATGYGRGEDRYLTAFVMGSKAEYLSGLGEGAIALVLKDLDALYGGTVAAHRWPLRHGARGDRDGGKGRWGAARRARVGRAKERGRPLATRRDPAAIVRPALATSLVGRLPLVHTVRLQVLFECGRCGTARPVEGVGVGEGAAFNVPRRPHGRTAPGCRRRARSGRGLSPRTWRRRPDGGSLRRHRPDR